MVNKLLKYEFKYYFRIMVFYLPIIIVLGILCRFVQFLDVDFRDQFGIIEMIYTTIKGSSYMALAFTSIACLLFTTILGVIRFYKNLYSSDGYLTFTLPVSNNKLLFTKLFSFVVCQTISALCVLIAWSTVIFTSKEFLDASYIFFVNLFEGNNFQILIQNMLDSWKILLHIPFYLVEYLVLLVCSVIFQTLLYYICISIGQLVNKGRILLSIGVYYGYSWITEFVASFIYCGIYVFLILGLTMLPAGIINAIAEFINNYIFWLIHFALIGGIILTAGLSILLYFLNLKIMNNKLNLE